VPLASLASPASMDPPPRSQTMRRGLRTPASWSTVPVAVVTDSSRRCRVLAAAFPGRAPMRRGGFHLGHAQRSALTVAVSRPSDRRDGGEADTRAEEAPSCAWAGDRGPGRATSLGPPSATVASRARPPRTGARRPRVRGGVVLPWSWRGRDRQRSPPTTKVPAGRSRGGVGSPDRRDTLAVTSAREDAHGSRILPCRHRFPGRPRCVGPRRGRTGS